MGLLDACAQSHRLSLLNSTIDKDSFSAVSVPRKSADFFGITQVIDAGLIENDRKQGLIKNLSQ